jgi:hypothetical protein
MKDHPQRTISHRRIAIAIGATVVSGVGLAVSAASSLERGGTDFDRLLIGAVSCSIVLAAHLLPAVNRTIVARALWAVCLLLAAWGHATYFTGAAGRAGVARSAQVATSGAADALRAELAAGAARPVEAVAADMAQARAKLAGTGAALERCRAASQTCTYASSADASARARVEGLGDELAAARRAADIRARLVVLAGQHDDAMSVAAADPVARALAPALGVTPGTLTTITATASAIVLELLAAYLWACAFGPAGAPQGDSGSKWMAWARGNPMRPLRAIARSKPADPQPGILALPKIRPSTLADRDIRRRNRLAAIARDSPA